MRSFLSFALVAASAGASRATPVPVDRSTELRAAPATALPIRGPRFSTVTVDLYLGLPLGPSPPGPMAELCRLADRGELRIVHHFASNGMPAAILQGEALLEAAREGRFIEMVDALEGRRGDAVSESPAATVEALLRAGREAGLAEEWLRAALEDHRYRVEVMQLAGESRAAARGPGQVWIHGAQVAPRALDRELDARVAIERERARALRGDGVPLTELYERLVAEREDGMPSGFSAGAKRRLSVELSGSPSRGPEVSPVTVVLFGSFACYPCLAQAAIVRRLEGRFPGVLRFVWKHAPQSPAGDLAAQVAAAAHAQGGFWALYEQATQRPAQALRFLSPSSWRGDLLGYATAAGLDEARIERELRADLYRAAIERDLADARRLEVPAGGALVNGVRVAPGQPWEAWEKLVQRELELGLLERLRR